MADIINSLLTRLSKEEIPNVYSKKTLSNYTKNRLLEFQEEHVLKLINILLNNHIALDLSNTGTGKTYVACAICKELNRKPIIICPKTLIYNWYLILSYFNIEAYDIVNFETIKNAKSYTNKKCAYRQQSKYIKLIDADIHESIYKWCLPSDAIIIIDEVHRCKDPSTFNGKLLLSTKQAIDNKIPVVLLSATIYEKFNDMKIVFYLLGIIPGIQNYNHYIKIVKNNHSEFRRKTDKENIKSTIIYKEIENFCSMLKIKDLGDRFPLNQVCVQQFMIDNFDDVKNAYDKIEKLIYKLKENTGSHHLAKIQKLKQEIELHKAPIFIEQAKLYLDEKKSVVIFVNYLDTLNFLIGELNIKCQIHGNQTLEERKNSIDLFQSNKENIIICQIRAGNVGIGLHDLDGNHPRISLINYPDSATDLLQALGRIYRSGTKSVVLQRIISIANIPYEMKIMDNINNKLKNISTINNDDLNTYNFEIIN